MRGIAPALRAGTMLKSQGGSGTAASAALGQPQKDPRVKSSPSQCKRMGWRFRSGNTVVRSLTLGLQLVVSVLGEQGQCPAAWGGTGTVTGTAFPCSCGSPCLPASQSGFASSEGGCCCRRGVLSNDT